MENISSAHSPVPGFNQDINIGSGIESEILDETHIPSADYKNIEKEDHVPDNFNIPSEFHEEQKSVVTDNYETNVTMDERYGTHSPNQIGLSSDKADLHHYGTSDFHSNEEINVKDIPEYPGSDYTQYESKDTEIMGHEEYHSVNKSSFSTETSHAESTFEVSNEKISSQLSNVQDDISPQFSENFSGLENKVLTEITEAKQYETLSKFEENVHTSNATYSESSLITNTVSDTIESQIPLSETSNFDNMNYNYISEETKHSTSEKNFEQTTTYAEEHITYGESTETSFSKVTSTLHAATTDEHDTALYGHQTDFNFSDGMHAFETSKFGDPNSGLVGDITQEENYDIKTSTTFETGTKTQEIESSDGVREMHTSSETTFGLTNGKDQGSWSHSEYSSQYVSETSPSIVESNTKYTTSSEQETEYIINSRFHSDSPEDNVMRSDSSPDVPPYPVNSDGHLDEKNSVLGSKSQSFIPDKDDYSNINLANVGGVPLSPNKTHNTNQDIPCGESSEDEDSSSVPGTVSHYAYTNKAYAKEEEDVDGNHIYMSSQYNQQELFMMEKSEILKEMEGQNQQTVTTHQMSYSQGFQESTGETNYDFHLEEWGKPMGLPTPPDSTKTAVKKADKSLTKTKTAGDTNGKAYSPSVASKLSSPMKKPKPKTTKESSSDPVYVDLAYVPHHGDPQYCDVEFFKKVRARYYVFSGINPSKEVLNALLEAKKSWKEDLEVTIIPTYETDTLGYWMAQNQDDLATYSIEVAPSASRCTVNLQDHETSCAAYRLEF
ncbi:microtubule-associated protein futsch [Caerostris darwini]|uniref:Microtubule-associated protein futsch n=1 Tax=Caerostris darwini TaxID=1538125 RepID=A0AAV4TT88_9ARAC|nr:microtubule-associated protein futsch [Caerostris darwini]